MESVHVWGRVQGVQGKSLYLLPSVAVNLKLLSKVKSVSKKKKKKKKKGNTICKHWQSLKEYPVTKIISL